MKTSSDISFCNKAPAIAIDIRPLQTDSRYRGVGVVLMNILERMLNMELDFEPILIANYGIEIPKMLIDSSWKIVRLHRNFGHPKLNSKLIWVPEKLFLRSTLRRLGVKLYFCSIFAECNYPVLIPDEEIRVVTWVWDLIPYQFSSIVKESFFQKLLGYRYKRKMKETTKSTLLLALSDDAKKDMVEILKVDPSRVEVIHLGVDFQTLEKRSDKNQFEKRYPELNRYILYIGGFEARKNIEGALSAFALIKDEFPDVSFVIGGKMRQGNPSYEGLLRFISKIGIADRVRFVGFVDNRYLGWFYSNALFHVFISFAEGFGLPPLEAMACGTPVLASNVSSIPEVVGDAAFCVDPYDIDKIAAAMRALISDEELRSELVKKGLERCRLFSWENSARKFTNILLSQVK